MWTDISLFCHSLHSATSASVVLIHYVIFVVICHFDDKTVFTWGLGGCQVGRYPGPPSHSHNEDVKSCSDILRCERNITFKGENAWRESSKKGLCLFLIKDICPAAGPLPIPGTTLIRLHPNLSGVHGTFGQPLPSLVKTALFVDVFDNLSEKEFSGMCNT